MSDNNNRERMSSSGKKPVPGKKPDTNKAKTGRPAGGSPAKKSVPAKAPVKASAKDPVKNTVPAKKSTPGLADRVRGYSFRLRKQKYAYGTVTTIFTIAVIACVVLVNVLIGIVTDKYGVKFDMTSDRRFAITSETANMLENLDDIIDIDVYMSEEDFRLQTFGNELTEILYKYKVHGSGKLNLTFVDPLRNPTYSNKYKSAVDISSGDIVVQKGDNFQVIVNSNLFYWYDSAKTTAVGTSIERVLTSTIINLGLTTEDKPTAALLTGHNERNLTAMLNLLKENSYNVTVLNLLTDDIPDGVSLLVMICPSNDYSEDEILKLEKYLANYKNFIYFAGAEVPELPLLDEFFIEWGAEFSYSVVADSSYRILGDYTKVVSIPSDTTDALVDGLGYNQYVIVPYARQMRKVSLNSSLVTVTELLTTSSVAYSKSLSGGPIASYEKADEDVSGPFSSAILTTKSGIIDNKYVYTNALFISSPYVFDDYYMSTQSYGNQRFVTNILAKFNPSNTALNIPNKKYTDPELEVVGNSLTLMLLLLCVMPAGAIVSGMVVWHRRKNR